MESTKEAEKVVADGTTPAVEEKKNSKAEREKKKEDARRAREEASKKGSQEYKKDPNDPCAHKFGDKELNRSQSDPDQRYARKFHEVHQLDETLAGQEVLVRGRLHNSRATGKKMVFLVLRERFSTV